jgi:hypothetical protein
MKNQKLVPTSAFLVMTMGTIASIEKDGNLPPINFWLGIAIAYLFIAVIEQFNSDFGAGLSILVLVSATFGYGEDIASFTSKRTSGKIGQPKPAREPGRIQPERRII